MLSMKTEHKAKKKPFLMFSVNKLKRKILKTSKMIDAVFSHSSAVKIWLSKQHMLTLHCSVMHFLIHFWRFLCLFFFLFLFFSKENLLLLFFWRGTVNSNTFCIFHTHTTGPLLVDIIFYNKKFHRMCHWRTELNQKMSFFIYFWRFHIRRKSLNKSLKNLHRHSLDNLLCTREFLPL